MQLRSMAVAAVAALALAAAPAWATPLTLTLTDGSNTVTVQDGGVGDMNGTNGAVTWIGSLGVWTVNVSTGLGNPVLGSSSWPILDLNSVNTSSGAGTLTLLLTQGGFTSPPPPGFMFNIGGTTNGTVTAYACAGVTLGNCEDVQLGPFNPVGSTAFSGSTSFPFADPDEAYQVGIKVVIHHNGATNSSFDAEVQPVPEPGTYALIGAGLLGLGLLRRRLS